MAFCLSNKAVEIFKSKLASGEITPEKLNEMDSKGRHEYFKSFLGEAAASKVNSLYESKLLLKNQQQGIITWASKFSKTQPTAYRDIISQVNKMDRVLSPKEEQSFYSDLARQKLGFGVTMEQASNIHDYAKKATELKSKVEEMISSKDYSRKNETVEQLQTRMEYGNAVQDFNGYYESVKASATSKTLAEYVKPSNWWEGIVKTAGFSKSMKASLDISVILRQGLKVAFAHPTVWAEKSWKAHEDFAKAFVGKDVMRAVMADALSRPNNVNGKYKEIGLDINVVEEAYPVSLAKPETPDGKAGGFKTVSDGAKTVASGFMKYLRRSFKASEVSFRAFQIRTRIDVADYLIDIAEQSGGEITGIGKVVNSLTGRGDLGKQGERYKTELNSLLFSPRLIKSNFDTLTGHVFSGAISKDMGAGLIAARGNPAKMSVARQEAALNTLKTISGIAGVLAIAKMLNPDSVEEDSTSSDFGKIKDGHTRFDVSGGMAGLVTLASRLITSSEKSAVTGVKTELNPGEFGGKSRADVVMNFVGNKMSPAASFIKDIATGKDFSGKATNPVSAAVNLFAPLPITNYIELKHNPNSANMIVALLSDNYGIGTNTFSYSSDWKQSEGKAINDFRAQVGEDKFNKANENFNLSMNTWLDSIGNNPTYNKLSDEDKKRVILNKKIEMKNNIFAQHAFYPSKAKSKGLPKL